MKLVDYKRVMIRYWLVGLFLMAAATVSAQRPSSEEWKQIQDARVGMITNRLNLTAEQSEKFWPLYNEFNEKRRVIRRNQRKIINEKREGGMTDQSALANLKEVQDLKQKEVDLENEYQSRFLKVISPSQLSELYKAEKSFNDMLLQRLNRRKNE